MIGHIVQWLVAVSFFLSIVFATSVSQAADAVAGKRLYPVCTACHGTAGQGNRGMGGPKLAGQQGIYLLRQLQNFQSGACGMSPGDAKGRQMAAMSKGPALSSAAALENLVAYLETLPDKPSTPTVDGDVGRGKNLYAACVSCHGEMAQGLEMVAAPRLAEQNDWYLVGQLQNFATGKRGYAPRDHSGRLMQAMIATLLEQSDYRDVVAYIKYLNAVTCPCAN